jgi:hypothetical protein
MKMELPEIRDLIRSYYLTAGWSTKEAAGKIAMAPSALQRLVEGSLTLSPQTFNKMLKGWEIARDPALLRVWLASWLVDRLGRVGEEWLLKAGWMPTEVPQRAPEPAFELYAVLGDSAGVARRRLAILRRLCVAGEGGCVFAEARCAAKDASNVVELDLKFLSDAKHVESWTSRVTLRHPMQGTFQQVERRATLRNWKATQTGRRVVAAMEGLPDVAAKCDG